MRATTICAVRHRGQGAMAGDGQVTLADKVILKQQARKVRRLYQGRVVAGFAGSVADALTLFEHFESQLQKQQGHLVQAAIQLTRQWRSDRMLRRLEAMLLVLDEKNLLLLSGTGEVIEPDDGILAIGSGGAYALTAARALKRHASQLDAATMAREALTLASEVCVYTNDAIVVEEVSPGGSEA